MNPLFIFAIAMIPVGSLIGWYVTDIDKLMSFLVGIAFFLIITVGVLLPVLAHSHSPMLHSAGLKGEAVVASVIGQGKAQGIEQQMASLLSGSIH